MGGWHHGMMMDGTHSAAEVSAHVDHMLKHFYVEIDATDAQKAQIAPLVKQAVNDLLPLHSQLQTAHTQVMQALMQTPIDRASLEAVPVRSRDRDLVAFYRRSRGAGRRHAGQAGAKYPAPG
jgi:Spy/CpxP family protein refolding chaperone